VEEIPRTIGQKAAKKATFEKKATNANKKAIDLIDLEEMKTFGKIQADEHANRLKALEVQEKLSSQKIEQAKLAHLAAKEQKEAAHAQREAAEAQREARKLELEAKMFDTYNKPIVVDVSMMFDEEKNDHASTVNLGNIIDC
jgi:hypothetical protein